MLPLLREPVRTFTVPKARSTFFDPHLTHASRVPAA
jgi:hypothetical protein